MSDARGRYKCVVLLLVASWIRDLSTSWVSLLVETVALGKSARMNEEYGIFTHVCNKDASVNKTCTVDVLMAVNATLVCRCLHCAAIHQQHVWLSDTCCFDSLFFVVQGTRNSYIQMQTGNSEYTVLVTSHMYTRVCSRHQNGRRAGRV